MKKPNIQRPENSIQQFDRRQSGNLRICAGISIGLGFWLTIYLSFQEQYLDSLISFALTIAAGTSDRLKTIRIGIKGLQSEWRDPPR